MLIFLRNKLTKFVLFKKEFKILFENEKIKKTINNFFKDLKKIYK